MKLVEPEIRKKYQDPSLGFNEFRSQFPNFSDKEFLSFLLEEAEKNLKNFSRSEALIQAWGVDATTILQEIIKDDEHKYIVSAIKIIGGLGNALLIKDLLQPLRSWAPAIRSSTIDAFAKLIDRSNMELIDNNLRNSNFWRVRAGITDALLVRFQSEDNYETLVGRRHNESLLEAITNNLGFQEPRVQVVSARLIGQLGHQLARPQLMKLIESKSSEVRTSALEALIYLGGRKTLQVLNQVLVKGQKDERMKIIALNTAVKMLDEINIDMILRLRYDQSEKVRSRVAWILRHYQGQRSLDELVTMLTDPSELVSEEAANSIITFGSRVSRAVIETVNKENKKRRSSSFLNLQALIILKEFDIGPFIRDFIEADFHRDKSVEVRRELMKELHLTTTRDKEFVTQEIFKVIPKEDDNEVLTSIATHLPVLSSRGTKKALLNLAHRKKGDLALKTAAMRSLSLLNWVPENEEDKIINLIAHGEWEYLATIEGKEKHDILLELLETGDMDSILGVIKTLELMTLTSKRKRYIEILRSLILHPDEEVKIKAITTLGIQRDAKSVGRFNQIWKTGNDTVRKAIIDAFDLWGEAEGVKGLIGLIPQADEEEFPLIEAVLTYTPDTEGAIQELSKGFESSNHDVRRICTNAAKQIKSQRLIPFLVDELFSDTRFVRLNAYEFLKNMEWKPDNEKNGLQYAIISHDWKLVTSYENKQVSKKIALLTEELNYLSSSSFEGLPTILAQYRKSVKYMRRNFKSESDLLVLLSMQVVAFNQEDDRSLKYIFSLVEHTSPEVREMVGISILKSAHIISVSSLINPISKLLSDKNEKVTLSGLRALRKISTIENSYLLFDYLKAGHLEPEHITEINHIFEELDTDLIELFMSQLTTLDPIVIELAIYHIQKMIDQKAIPNLEDYLKKGNEAQIIVSLSVLSAIDMNKYIGDLTRKLKDESEEIRYRALDAVGESIPQESLRNFIEPMIKDEDARIRYKAAQILVSKNYTLSSEELNYHQLIALAEWEKAAEISPFDDFMEKRMVQAIKCNDVEVMYKTGLAMARIANTSSYLLGDMLFSNDFEQQYAVEREIMQLGTDVGSILIDAFDRHKEDFQRLKVLALMSQIRTETHERKLIEIIRSAEIENIVKDSAMHILLEYDSKIAIPTFIEMLQTDDTKINQMVADELVDIGLESLEPLLSILDQVANETKTKVIQVIGRLGSEIAIPRLRPYLNSANLDIRHAAGIALEEIGWNPKNASDRVVLLSSNEKWNRIIHLQDEAMTQLIIMIESDPIESMRNKAAEAMKSIWPHLGERNANEYIRRFKRMLGPGSHEVYESLINFGVHNQQSLLRRIFSSISNLIKSNMYYFGSIISGLFIVGLVNNTLEDPGLYFQLQLTLLVIIMVFQLVQAFFITNYAEKFIKVVERLGSVLGRGQNASIWANKNFSMIVGIIFVSSLYQFLTQPANPDARSFINEQDTLIGKIMIRFTAGDFGLFDIQAIQLPSFRITSWFDIFDLPDLSAIFNESNLSLLLRGVIFLAIAWEVSRVGIRAIWLQDPIPNNPARFYQKFALPIGTLLFYMLAFVEESNYARAQDEPLKYVPVQAAKIGILIGSLVYLVGFAKDRIQGWATVLALIMSILFLKFLEILLVDGAINPFLGENPENQQIFDTIIGTIVVIIVLALITKFLTDRLKSQHSSDNKTIAYTITYTWSILWLTAVAYIFLFAVELLHEEQTAQVLVIIGLLLSTGVSSFLVAIWSFSMLRHKPLRLHSIMTLIPVVGMLYYLSNRNSENPIFYYLSYAEQSILNFNNSIIPTFTLFDVTYTTGEILMLLSVLPLIFLMFLLFRRTARKAIDHAGIEGIDPKVKRHIRLSRLIWLVFIVAFGMVNGFPFYGLLFVV